MSNNFYRVIIALIALNVFTVCYGAVTFKEIARTAYNKDPLIPITQNFGIKYVVNDSISTGRTSNSTFTIKTINHIYNGTDGNYVDYKYDLSVTNSAGDVISTNFTVQYQANTKKNVLLSMGYKVTYGKYANQTNSTGTTNTTKPNNTTNSTSSNNTTKPTTPSTNTTTPVKNTTSTNTTKPITPSTNTTTPVKNTTSTNSTNSTNTGTPYALVNQTAYNQTLYQTLANYGVQYVAAKAINQTVIPAGDYILLDIYSIYQQVVSASITNYKFDVEFAKTDGSRVVESNFTIQYLAKLDTKNVLTFGYSVLPYVA